MTATERRLIEMLEMICNRANRPEKAGSAQIMVCKVPAGLIENARALLDSVKNDPYSR